MPTPIAIAFIVVALFAAAFFAGAETALTAASRARLRALETAGDERAALVARLMATRSRFVSAMLLGGQLVTIAASALATNALVATTGERGVVYATVIMTALIVVFGEVLPKTIAHRLSRPHVADHRADGVVLRHGVRARRQRGRRAGPPHAAAVRRLARRSPERLGIRGAARRGRYPPQRGRASRATSATCSAGCSSSPRSPSPTSWSTAPRCARSTPTCRPTSWCARCSPRPTPACRCGAATPTTSSACCTPRTCCAPSPRLAATPAASTPPTSRSRPWFVPEATTLRDQLKAFLRRKIHSALVVDEYGVVLGLLTLEDIIEEIVGDIKDEHDVTVQGVRQQLDGSLIVDGSVTIRDLNRAMDWSLPDDEAATIAGLVIHEARAIPEPKQTFSFHGLRFEVLRKQRNRIAALRITPLTPPRAAARRSAAADGQSARLTALSRLALPRAAGLAYIGARMARSSAEARSHVLEQSRRRTLAFAGAGAVGPGARRTAPAERSRGMHPPRAGGGLRGLASGRRRPAASAAAAHPARGAHRAARLVRARARSTPSSPTRSASISCSAATPARPRPASTPTGPGRSARSSRSRSADQQITEVGYRGDAQFRRHSRREPDADRRPEHRQRPFPRELADRSRPSRGLRVQHSQSRARRSKRSPRASCARWSA